MFASLFYQFLLISSPQSEFIFCLTLLPYHIRVECWALSVKCSLNVGGSRTTQHLTRMAM